MAVNVGAHNVIWEGAGTPAYLAVFASETFFNDDGNVIPKGDPSRLSGGWYRRVAVTVTGNLISVPALNGANALDTTYDQATGRNKAEYIVGLYASGGKQLTTLYANIKVPDTPTNTHWEELFLFSNAVRQSMRRDYYDTYEVNRLLQTVAPDWGNIDGDISDQEDLQEALDDAGGDYIASSDSADVGDLITAIGASELPVLLDDSKTVDAAEVFPDNTNILLGGGKFTKSSGGIEFEGNPMAGYPLDKPIFESFAAGDVTFTGTDHPKQVGAEWWNTGDTSLTERVRRADAAVAGKYAKIIAYAREITRSATITENHHLHFEPGDYSSSLATVASGQPDQYHGAFLLKSNTRVTGSNLAIIRESPVDGNTLIFQAHHMRFGGGESDEIVENIIIEDLLIQGDEAQFDITGSNSIMLLGNCHKSIMRRLRFIRAHGYCTVIGGSGVSGNYPFNSGIEHCQYHGMGSQLAVILHGINCWIRHCHFDQTATNNLSTYVCIDVEPNDGLSKLENIWVEWNTLDFKNETVGGKYGGGIAVQGLGLNIPRSIYVRYNDILGMDVQDVLTGGDHALWPLSIGIQANGGQDFHIEGNYVRGAVGIAYFLANLYGVSFTDNKSWLCADSNGNAATLRIWAVRDGIIRDNNFPEAGVGFDSCGIHESELEIPYTSTGSTVTIHVSAAYFPYPWWEGLTIDINGAEKIVDAVTLDTINPNETFTTTTSLGTVAVAALASATDVNTSTNKLLKTSHGFENNARLKYVAGTTPIVATPALADGQIVHVVNKSANDWQISATQGGAAMDLTNAGTGTQTFIPVFRTQFSNNKYINNDCSFIRLEPTGTSKILSTAYDDCIEEVNNTNITVPARGGRYVFKNLSAGRTATLPDATTCNGLILEFRDGSGLAESFNITVDALGSQTIQGDLTVVIGVNYGHVRIQSDGAQWMVLEKNIAIPAFPDFTPADLANIAYRWKASDLSLSDNDPVATWADSIGSADLTEATNRPTYKANSGDPYVEFDGSNDKLTATIASLTDFVAVFVCEWVTNSGSPRMLDTTGNGIRVMTFGTASLLLVPQGGTVFVAMPAAPTGFFASRASRIGTAGVITVNGTVSSPDTVDATAVGTTLYVGCDNASGNFCNVRIKELFIMNGDFEEFELSWLRQYIDEEYGLTL